MLNSDYIFTKKTARIKDDRCLGKKMDNDALAVKRLAWACRRGMLELDLILLPFLNNHYARLNPQEQASFKQLLECNDQALYNYFIKQHEPDNPSLSSIIKKILYHVHTGH
jgi:antitoxin CptB